MYEMTSDFKIKNGSTTVQYKSSLLNQIALLHNIATCFGLIESHCKIVFARITKRKVVFLENNGYFTIVFQKCYETSAPIF